MFNGNISGRKGGARQEELCAILSCEQTCDFVMLQFFWLCLFNSEADSQL